ncbi:MurR/RpiR family transcriptional regulator [Labedella phragmitis]|uniref:MurR/RpiR family transcriptional regulator n=1 Tax=Labedella phragmitis TaxID=2498849 RepID=A0A444PRG4_9MICO|nr:MurR/RpiR family transcriptional regulator [Labedella phragmitis]RWZ49814.1 MurR/RpiR family transcriptional regulator [Labedella phragmitis]
MTFDPGMPLLEHLAAELPSLRRSEKKVAELVASDPGFIVQGTMASVAEAAGVSEPTVMRFCTALGYDGFNQFRLALAQSVALGLPATLSTVSANDSIAVMASKVFDHSISSLDRARRYLDAAQIERAVDAILGARSLILTGLGASGIIAQDAAQKAPLFGVPCVVPTDPHQALMTVAVADPDDVLLAISNTGTTSSVIEIVDAAQAAGATVIGLTGADDSPLAQRVDIALVARTFEDTDMYTPTVSRIAALVIVDVLGTAVALRRGERHAERLSSMKEQLVTFRRRSAE